MSSDSRGVVFHHPTKQGFSYVILVGDDSFANVMRNRLIENLPHFDNPGDAFMGALVQGPENGVSLMPAVIEDIRNTYAAYDVAPKTYPIFGEGV